MWEGRAGLSTENLGIAPDGIVYGVSELYQRDLQANFPLLLFIPVVSGLHLLLDGVEKDQWSCYLVEFPLSLLSLAVLLRYRTLNQLDAKY